MDCLNCNGNSMYDVYSPASKFEATCMCSCNKRVGKIMEGVPRLAYREAGSKSWLCTPDDIEKIGEMYPLYNIIKKSPLPPA